MLLYVMAKKGTLSRPIFKGAIFVPLLQSTVYICNIYNFGALYLPIETFF